MVSDENFWFSFFMHCKTVGESLQKNILLTLMRNCSKVQHFNRVEITAACNFIFDIVTIFKFKDAICQ